jgi:hypothetical protein
MIGTDNNDIITIVVAHYQQWLKLLLAWLAEARRLPIPRQVAKTHWRGQGRTENSE